MMRFGLYVHVPFCAAKCGYCDFISFAGQESLHEKYVNVLTGELRKNVHLRSRTVTSVFIGGGTPTALPPLFLYRILEEISKLKLSDDCEITVEANPGTLNKEMLRMLLGSGVNRLSIGLQAWQNELLKRLGRIHDSEMFIKNYTDAVEIGFKNVNVDVMFALPGQTERDWEETVNNVILLNVEHISAYSLIIEEGTEIHRAQQNNLLEPPDEDADRRMYGLLKDMLKANGYHHYEISNFAKPGYECRHNTLYWERGEYVGAGLAAHSYVNGRRYHNTLELSEYLRSDFRERDAEQLTESDKMLETIFLGLRMRKGISEAEFFREFGININDVYGDTITELIEGRLLEKQNGRILLTERGIDVSNSVFVKFF